MLSRDLDFDFETWAICFMGKRGGVSGTFGGKTKDRHTYTDEIHTVYSS